MVRSSIGAPSAGCFITQTAAYNTSAKTTSPFAALVIFVYLETLYTPTRRFSSLYYLTSAAFKNPPNN